MHCLKCQVLATAQTQASVYEVPSAWDSTDENPYMKCQVLGTAQTQASVHEVPSACDSTNLKPYTARKYSKEMERVLSPYY